MDEKTLKIMDELKLNGRIRKILKADISLKDKKLLLEAEKIDTLNYIYRELRHDEDDY